MNKLGIAALMVAASLALGATVFREHVAWAAQIVDAHVTNVDANGNINVHEQRTAQVACTDGLDPAANTVKLDASGPLATSAARPAQRTPVVVRVRADGFHWGDAAIGATATLGLALAGGGLHALRRSDGQNQLPERNQR